MGRCGEHRTGGANPPGPRALQPYPPTRRARCTADAQRLCCAKNPIRHATETTRFSAIWQPAAVHYRERFDPEPVLEICGGENIFAESRVPRPQVSREQVLARQPQAIVVVGNASEIPKIEQFWHRQLKIPVIALNSDWFERASPRIILAAKQLCAELAESHSNR